MSADRRPSSFFEVPGGSSSRRRLLLIALLFPPGHGVGALRWQKMARYVHERGWDLDVVTIHPDCIDAPDWSRVADLPPGTRLYGVRKPVVPLARIIEALWNGLRRVRSKFGRRAVDAVAPSRNGVRPASLARSEITWRWTEPRSYVRAYNAWFLYAELERWARDASSIAADVVAPGVHEAIISSGPPHAGHEVARRVARRTGLPFVMDMRDLWSLMQRCPETIASPLLLRLARRYEHQAVDHASLVIANTEPACSAMIDAHPAAGERIIAVMNGFDDEPLPPTRHGSRFVIAYAGSIYLDRDPSGVFRAARQVIEELRLSPAQFGLEFIGANDWSVSIRDMAEAAGIGPFVTVGDPRPRARALEFLAQASMLVILPQDSDMAIPAKVFEYVRFEAWLLALAERNSATELVLRATAADVVSSSDTGAIAAIVRERYRQFAAGIRPHAVADDPRLSRHTQARVLLDALERCIRLTRPDGAMGVPAAMAQRVAG